MRLAVVLAAALTILLAGGCAHRPIDGLNQSIDWPRQSYRFVGYSDASGYPLTVYRKPGYTKYVYEPACYELEVPDTPQK